MRVLIACEESQVECLAFRNCGVSAYSCDLKPCSGGHPEWHIRGNVSSYLDGRCRFVTEDGQAHIIEGRWDLIIAHPPCTYLSKAGSTIMFPKPGLANPARVTRAILARDFFMKCLQADCEFVAVENPIPMKFVSLPTPTTYVEPFWFGHPFTKKTYLWLKNLPPLMPTEFVHPKASWVYWVGGGGDYQTRRSKSFEGIARAMAAQWIPIVDDYLKKGVKS